MKMIILLFEPWWSYWEGGNAMECEQDDACNLLKL